MNPPLTAQKLRRIPTRLREAIWPAKEPRFARRRITAQARRLRRHAEAYDQLLMRRLADRGELSPALETDGEIPVEEDALLDTALYRAASNENACAAALVRRDRLLLAAIAGVTGACVALAAKARTR